MADSGFLEKDYEVTARGQAEMSKEEVYDEAEEHRRRMAAKFEELCAQPVDYAKYAERARESYFSSDREENRYTDYPIENRAPRPAPVSAPQPAPSETAPSPSAINRINDYMESSRRIEEMLKSVQASKNNAYAPAEELYEEGPAAPEMAAASEMQFAPEMAAASEMQFAPEMAAASEMQFAPEMAAASEMQFAPGMAAASETQFAPEMQYASEMQYGPEPQFAAPREEYMSWLYREGIVQSQELAPLSDAPATNLPFHDFAGGYRAEEETGEADAKPTKETMSYVSEEEEIEDEAETIVVSSVSSKTKIVLAAIAAAVMILLAIICINAAVIKSLNADVSFREQTFTDLSKTLRGIEREIDDLTSPENVENWAAEHGMTPPEP